MAMIATGIMERGSPRNTSRFNPTIVYVSRKKHQFVIAPLIGSIRLASPVQIRIRDRISGMMIN